MNNTIAIIGLGYVGLPLAIEFGKKFKVIGFDLSEAKIKHYKDGFDPMGQISCDVFKELKNTVFTNDPAQLALADFIIVAVPTPVDDAHIPDLTPLKSASILVGQNMKKGALVIYESTVYPGATEEVCIPLLEQKSGMSRGVDFNVGYSPERVNPGDKVKTLTSIVKVVSGDSLETLERVSNLYGSIITAGIHRTTSIKVAEASKVIENTQRDLNIALMNELSILFEKIGIDTLEVLEAAGTKWNFLPFRPGLVGGHCIGVDPYYLTHKAEMLGYHPQVILAGRRINDGMASHIANITVQKMIEQGGCAKGDTVLVLGITFKENCPDLRNSKVVELVNYLKGYGLNVLICDPIASPSEAQDEYGLKLVSWESVPRNIRAIIAAVSHENFIKMPIDDILAPLAANGVFIDVKSAYPVEAIKQAGHNLWRL
jgi:UDP-N-acetyl-D-galactosamine dehydrogenase